MRIDRTEADRSLAANADFTAKLAGSWPSGPSPLSAIRRKCIDCVAGEIGLIADCALRNCALWPYRLGRNPFHGSAA